MGSTLKITGQNQKRPAPYGTSPFSKDYACRLASRAIVDIKASVRSTEIATFGFAGHLTNDRTSYAANGSADCSTLNCASGNPANHRTGTSTHGSGLLRPRTCRSCHKRGKSYTNNQHFLHN